MTSDPYSPATLAEYYANLAARAGLAPHGTSSNQGAQRVEWKGRDFVRFFVPDAWPEPVDTPAAIAEALAVIRTHVSIPDHEALVAALWALHTHVLDDFDITPRLVISSTLPASGKTSLLAALTCLVARPLDLCAATTRGILESIGYRPTLLIDDAPDLLRDKGSLATIIRNGRQRNGAKLVSCWPELGLRSMILFTPIAAAVEGKPPPVFSGRGIEIRLERLPRGQAFHRPVVDDLNLPDVTKKLARWAADCRGHLRDWQWPRSADRDENWTPLLAIATNAGLEWLARACAAKEHIRAQSGRTPLETLLADIHGLMDKDRIRSADLAKQLAGLEDRPWGEWEETGRPITPNKIARMLAQVNVRPRTLRFHEEDGPGSYDKGYLYEQFADAFERYLGVPRATQAG